MSNTALVTCNECGGTGYGHDRPVCGVCLGQMHISVDRTKDGGVPDQYRLWREWSLGEVPNNPLILRNDATQR